MGGGLLGAFKGLGSCRVRVGCSCMGSWIGGFWLANEDSGCVLTREDFDESRSKEKIEFL